MKNTLLILKNVENFLKKKVSATMDSRLRGNDILKNIKIFSSQNMKKLRF